MFILTVIVWGLATIILIVFVAYLLWQHSKRSIDPRPDEVKALAEENAWQFSVKSTQLEQLIKAGQHGYMGRGYELENVCTQQQAGDTAYIFDCFTATPISGIAIEFETAELPQMQAAEHLLKNRLGPLQTTQIEPDQLPRFIKARLLVYAPADQHGEISAFIAENDAFQALLKRRDLGYFTMQGNCVVFYFLTRHPAEQWDFSKITERVNQIKQIPQ
jgi:hypothetical protein